MHYKPMRQNIPSCFKPKKNVSQIYYEKPKQGITHKKAITNQSVT